MSLVTLVKEVPNTRDMALTRVFFLIPGLICAGVIAMSGVNIDMPTETSTTITKDLNTTSVWSATSVHTNVISLQSPVWIMVHVMFFFVIFWFLISQVMFILKHPENN